MLANPSITINERGARRLIRASEKKIIQKVHPTPLVFNTLMLGALKFAGCERALEIYYEMKEDGWGLDISGLTHFLHDCISRADWDNGVYVWNEMLSIITKIKDSQKEAAYSNMLSLCSVTGNTAVFNHLLKDVVNQGLDRRSIIKLALKTAQKLHGRPDSTTPPMAADNVLFAIGEYMNDAVEKDSPEKQTAYLENDNPPLPVSQQEDIPVRDADADWSSWVGSELTEPTDQAYVRLPDSTSLDVPALDPDEGFASWAELELHKDPDQGPPDATDASTVVNRRSKQRP
jgi:hypothetical protein